MKRLDAAIKYAMEVMNAEGNAGGPDLPSDQAQDGGQGKGGKDRAVSDRTVARYWEKAQIEAGYFPSQIRRADIREAIKKSKGSAVRAARMLKMTVSELEKQYDFQREMSKYLQDFRDEMAKDNPEYINRTLSEVEEDMRKRAVFYRAEALEALHDLASLPVDAETNSALAQVKLIAAQRLYQETGQTDNPNDMESTLRVLNQRFQEAAPRIKQIRERIIQFENGGPKLIEASGSVVE
jgi:hypothetical protein